MTNLYHRSTLQIIRQSSGGLVLPKSGIKPFLTGGLNETTIFRPRLLDYQPDPQEKKGKAFGRKLTRNHFFCACRFCYCILVFFQTAKTYKLTRALLLLLLIFFLSGRIQLVVVRVICIVFSIKPLQPYSVSDFCDHFDFLP